jgi:hypothetical protein
VYQFLTCLNSIIQSCNSLLSLNRTMLRVYSSRNRPVQHLKETCFISVTDVTYTKFLKQVGKICGFPLFSTYSISTVLLTMCFLQFVMPRFPSRQPSICCFQILATQPFSKLLWLTFQPWATGMDTMSSYNTKPPIKVLLNIWTISFTFLFSRCPCSTSYISHSSHSFSCCCITCVIVDSDTPVISAIWE